MDKTAVEDFADLAGRARADLKVLENRRDAAREREESNRNINSRSGERECNTAMGKVLALNSAITNMRYFAKALGEAHAREVCRDLKAMPAEEKYGQPCKCGDDLCGYWYCKCPLRASRDNYCGTCYLYSPYLREDVGEWCEATRKWKCKCAAGNDWACCGHIYHLSLFTSKCTGCGAIRPPMDLLAEEIKYGKWCEATGDWTCECYAPYDWPCCGHVFHLRSSNKCSKCGVCKPAEQKVKYGKWCTCGSCASWKCNCDGGRRDQFSDEKACVVCKYKRPVEPLKYGTWCSCGCGQWRCDCDQHGVKSRRLSTTSKCSKCSHLKPKESL